MSTTYQLTPRSIPLDDTWDVIVAGGGRPAVRRRQPRRGKGRARCCSKQQAPSAVWARWDWCHFSAGMRMATR